MLAHQGTFRDGEDPLPYITHPLDVVNKLRYIGGVTDETVLMAAALHDVVEESTVTLQEIEEAFGDDVAQLVRQVTRREPSEAEIEGLDKDAVWKLRSEILLEEIRTQMSPRAWLIKMADRVSNLEGAKVTKKGKKLERYLDQSRAILKIIPKETNPGLWQAIQALC